MPGIPRAIADRMYQQDLLSQASPQQPRVAPPGLGIYGPGGLADVISQRASEARARQAMPSVFEQTPEQLAEYAEPVMGFLGPLVGPRAVTAFKGMPAYHGGPTYRETTKGRTLIKDDPWVETREFNHPNKPWAGFFSDDVRVANRFAETFNSFTPSATYRVKINFKNPVEIDAKGRHAAAYQFDSVGREQGVKKATGLIDRLFEKNPKVDGVIIKNTADEGTIYVPRISSQIESAIGGGR